MDHASIGKTTMDYLVEFTITIPDGAPPAEIERRQADETHRVAELAAQGHALRVWKPPPEDGRQRALGLYRAASDEELQAILDSLPLRPWMQVSVTALAEHPNDPARSAACPGRHQQVATSIGPRADTPDLRRTHDEHPAQPRVAPRLPARR